MYVLLIRSPDSIPTITSNNGFQLPSMIFVWNVQVSANATLYALVDESVSGFWPEDWSMKTF